MSRLLALGLVSLLLCLAQRAQGEEGSEALQIGTRRELLVDDFLIESLEGVRHRIHRPVAREIALRFDRPWEGAFCGYATVLHDEGMYRLYYRGLPEAGRDGSAAEVTCYAESRDGIEWTKPNLGLYEYEGSKENNIVLMGQTPASHNFSPFIDTNPAADPQERYKALGGTAKGLLAFVSPDGLNWRRLRDDPVFTQGVFDSQNVSFWSETEQRYLLYFRTFTRTEQGSFRTISRTTSEDFVHWAEPVEMTFGDTPREHLYTNQTSPYFRAPHLYLGVAARFFPGRQVLSATDAQRVEVNPGYFGDISDAVLLSSRGGDRYDRAFMESFVRPGLGLENWVSRTNYPALGIIPTGDDELSVFIQKNYGQPTAHLMRYSMRLDGFASIEADYAPGEWTTRLIEVPSPPLTAAELSEKRAETSQGETDRPLSFVSESAIRGARSLKMRGAEPITLPGTQELGAEATLAVHVRGVAGRHSRVFSAYNGGTPDAGEFLIDVNPAGKVDPSGSIRVIYGERKIGVPFERVGVWSGEADSERVHHLALTWNRGQMRVYFDGELVAEDGEPSDEVLRFSLGDLRFGEDYPPTRLDNEAFLGEFDDLLVLPRALSHDEIARLAAEGAGKSLTADDLAGAGVLFDGEGVEDNVLVNRLGDETGVSLIPAAVAGRELLLNFATSAAGSVRVEVLDETGVPIPGFTLADADTLIGDRIERAASWRGRTDLSGLAGRSVRFRFVMQDANVFALRIY